MDKIISFPGPKAAAPEVPETITDLNIPPEKAAIYESIRRTFDFLFANKDTIDTFLLVATLKDSNGIPSGIVLNSEMKPQDYSYLLHMVERDFHMNAFM